MALVTVSWSRKDWPRLPWKMLVIQVQYCEEGLVEAQLLQEHGPVLGGVVRAEDGHVGSPGRRWTRRNASTEMRKRSPPAARAAGGGTWSSHREPAGRPDRYPAIQICVGKKMPSSKPYPGDPLGRVGLAKFCTRFAATSEKKYWESQR